MEIVHEVSKDEPIINIEGKKGESLFYHPVMWAIKGDFERIEGRFEDYKKLIEPTKEERLLALLGTMCMEEALDLFLGAYIPKYNRLKSQRDFTLFLKIELGSSLRVVPAHILGAATLVNSIRNKFAHELKIDCFDSLDSGTKDNLKQKHRVFFPNAKKPSITVKDAFIEILETVILGLGIYTPHLKTAKEYIYSKDFLNEIDNRMKSKSG